MEPTRGSDEPLPRPIGAAIAVARRLGVEVTEPVLLQDSNNTVVWLTPAAVVAKVAPLPAERLRHELAVARHLSAAGAPIVPLADDLPPMLHRRDGFAVTFWQCHRPDEGVDPSPDAVAGALRRVHTLLQRYEGRLPSFRAELEQVDRLLSEDPPAEKALSRADRALLTTALRERLRELDSVPWTQTRLHGAPHQGNWLLSDGRLLILDLETACRGPLEWDLAHLPEEVASAYGSLDADRLSLCRLLVSVKVASWCWAKLDRSPELRWHAEHHLAQVRESVG